MVAEEKGARRRDDGSEAKSGFVMVPHGPHTLGGPVVPRGAVLYPGISFTYELEVTSSTSVPGVYNVAFVSGQRFKGRLSTPCPELRPHEPARVPIHLNSPTRPGRYSATWRLMTPGGEFEGADIEVEISVVDPDETPCVARFVSDVTVDDRTEVAPGEAVTKIWRVRNTGSGDAE